MPPSLLIVSPALGAPLFGSNRFRSQQPEDERLRVAAGVVRAFTAVQTTGDVTGSKKPRDGRAALRERAAVVIDAPASLFRQILRRRQERRIPAGDAPRSKSPADMMAVTQ